MRTRKEYIESLRDGREVYFKGERVADVTRHEEMSLAIAHAAIDYDMAEDSTLRDLAVCRENEEVFSRYYRLPRSADDLLRRTELIEAATTLGGTMVVLIKEIGTDALFALHRVAEALDAYPLAACVKVSRIGMRTRWRHERRQRRTH